MKKLLLALVATVTLGACGPSASSRPAPTPSGMVFGAASPTAAIETFFAAVKAGDLQAMGAIWGNKDGPAIRQFDREELEKRELLMICHLNHDGARIVEQVRAGEPQYTVYRTELKKGSLTRFTNISTIQGPQGRWYVVDADIMAVREFCQPPRAGSPPR